MTDETAKGPEPTVEELKAKAYQPMEDAMKLHPFYRGKIEITLKCWCATSRTSPSGTRPVSLLPATTYRPIPGAFSSIPTRATRSPWSGRHQRAGLGDIGPEAALPVMEGKACSSSTSAGWMPSQSATTRTPSK